MRPRPWHPITLLIRSAFPIDGSKTPGMRGSEDLGNYDNGGWVDVLLDDVHPLFRAQLLGQVSLSVPLSGL